MQHKIIPFVLCLFEGEGAAPAAQGETTANPANTQQETVLYGKQPEPEKPEKTESNTSEERKAQWRKMVEGDYKDLFGEDVQRIVNRRFKDTKTLQAQIDGMKPVFDRLAERYGETDAAKLAEKIDNDTAYWSEAAEEAGLTVEQYKEMKKLQRENAELREAQRKADGQKEADEQYARWMEEANSLKAKYNGFDLNAETQNPEFIRLLQSGVSMELAYTVIHHEDMMRDGMSFSAAQTEQRVTDNIRARGARPAEAGAAAHSGHVVKSDPSKLTKQDYKNIAKRVAMGEIITF